MLTQIPIVDLDSIGLHNSENVDKSTMNRVAKELDSAFSTVGFVYLKNHGIPQSTIDRVFRISRTFFQLPEEVKGRVRKETNKNDGFVGQNQEIFDSKQANEVRESYNCTSLSGLFPDDILPEFRQSVNDLSPKLCQLTNRLLKCLAIALGLDEDWLVERHQFMFQGVKLNGTTVRTLFYPSLENTDLSQPGLTRCGQHSDYGTITLLMQDDMGGLEVLSGSTWLPAQPIPGAILVNLGDLMQFWTSDRYKATVHRVLVPEEEIRRRSHRQSIAFFVHPDNEVIIKPLDGSNKHEPVQSLAYFKSRLSSSYKF